jgi:hypothetical protein
MPVERLECSIWNNGQSGWGIKVLGGKDVRRGHFDRRLSPVIVEIDGIETAVNIDKDSFWNDTCGELINKVFREFKVRHNLKSSDRVWLKIIETRRKFRLERE